MSYRFGAALARILHEIAMWRHRRTGVDAWLYVALVIMVAEVELRKEITRHKARSS
jgi:hypothetical protein